MGNKKFHGGYNKGNNGTNPAVMHEFVRASIKKELKEAKESGIRWGTFAYRIVISMILMDKFQFTSEQLNKLSKYCNSMADTLMQDYATIEDFIKVLKEEGNMDIDEKTLKEIYPDLEDFFPDSK